MWARGSVVHLPRQFPTSISTCSTKALVSDQRARWLGLQRLQTGRPTNFTRPLQTSACAHLKDRSVKFGDDTVQLAESRRHGVRPVKWLIRRLGWMRKANAADNKVHNGLSSGTPTLETSC